LYLKAFYDMIYYLENELKFTNPCVGACVPLAKRNGMLRMRPTIRNPIPLEIRRLWDLLNAKSYVVAKRPPAGVARKFGEVVPAQVSYDSGSKLRGPSLNSPRIASKRDVNIT
ncbi:hypothetical protein AVEN_69066-1, partial [Araneus ventricosus]